MNIYTYKIQINELNNQIDQCLQFHDIQLEDVNRNMQIIKEAIIEYPNNKNIKILSQINQDFIELERTLNLIKNFLQMNVHIVQKLINKHQRIMLGQEKVVQLDYVLEKLHNKQKDCVERQEQSMQTLTNLFSQLMNQSSIKAQQYLIKHSSIQTNITKKQKIFNYLNGMITAFFIVTTISMLIVVTYLVQNKDILIEKPSDIQILSFRICYMVGLSIVSQAVVQMVCEHRINYTFLLEMPTNKVSVGFRRTFIIGFTYLVICNICFILYTCTYVQQIEQINMEIVLSYIAKQVSKLLKPVYWAAIPVWILILDVLINIILISLGHREIYYIILRNFIQMFDIKNNITFYSYVIADILTSYYIFFQDIATIVTFGHEQAWLVYILWILFPTLRIAQQIRKYKQFKHVSPYITNSIKYILSDIGNIVVFYDLQYKNEVLLKFCFSFETMAILVKIYWEVVQDAGLLTGGAGSKEFTNQQNKWKNRFFVRRSSQMPVWFSVFFIVFNTCCRALYLLEYKYIENIPVMSLLVFIELIRRTLWFIFRLDNQQATNCEHYTATRFIPITLQKDTLQYVRQSSKMRKNSLKNLQLSQLQKELSTDEDESTVTYTTQ